MTRRDLLVAAVASGLTLCAVVLGAAATPIMGSAAFEWNDIPVKQDGARSVRSFFSAPTATLDQLEVHVSTLPPGQYSHPPHQHPNEELVIVKEGTVEVLVDGQTQRVGPGSVVFNASNHLHSLKNVGTGPAVYHVINWKPRGN